MHLSIHSTLLTILFPIFASYKALTTSSPALLTPWLHYWVVLSLVALLESHLSFILSYLPFYAWARLTLHLYLLLPGEQQGATFLYNTYIQPFLAQHETDIEKFISTGHDRAKAAGLDYLKRATDLVKVHVLGLQPTPAPAAQSSALNSNVTYAQQLFARFGLPNTQDGTPLAPAGDVYSLLSTALQLATTTGLSGIGSTSARAADVSAKGMLVPPGIAPEERMGYITAQRERLRVLLQAFDKEAGEAVASTAAMLSSAATVSAPDVGEMKKSKSEAEFETISREDGAAAAAAAASSAEKEVKAAGWGSWIWGSKKPAATAPPKEMSTKGKSTGVDKSP